MQVCQSFSWLKIIHTTSDALKSRHYETIYTSDESIICFWFYALIKSSLVEYVNGIDFVEQFNLKQFLYFAITSHSIEQKLFPAILATRIIMPSSILLRTRPNARYKLNANIQYFLWTIPFVNVGREDALRDSPGCHYVEFSINYREAHIALMTSHSTIMANWRGL